MDVVLRVIEGAKEGSKVKVKKEKFLIGRSPDCHLCAGSTAISRKHCAIKRRDGKVTIKDLGSRNGTVVNGTKIDAEVELSSGDELVVGPLKFLVTITHGISSTKKPEVKSVAEAVERTVGKSGGVPQDDDITDWLLEPSSPPPKSIAETQTIEMDDTNALHMQKLLQEEANGSLTVKAEDSEEENTGDTDAAVDESKKKEPGKLPKIPSKPATNDSREAAAQALRNWNRRR